MEHSGAADAFHRPASGFVISARYGPAPVGTGCAHHGHMTSHSSSEGRHASASSVSLTALISEPIELVHRVASGMERKRSDVFDKSELLSAGFAGLVEAAHRYQPGRGAAFATFACYRIAGAMRDELRARRAREVWDLGDLDEADEPADPAPSADDTLAARDVLTSLSLALEALPERERVLIERCYLDGVALSTVAAELGVSASRASRLRARAVAALRGSVERALGS